MNKTITMYYTRITNAEARKRFDTGEPVWACPVHLKPNPNYGVGCRLPIKDAWCGDHFASSFEEEVNEISRWTCSAKAGRYLAYYVRILRTRSLVPLRP